MKNKYLWVGSILSLVLVFDQVTKYLIEKHVRLFETITVIPGFFNVTHVRNRGAAFGVLATVPGLWRGVFFISVTLIALAVIAILIRAATERLHIISFALIASGAIGNLIDRLRYSEVVDFIQWYAGSFYWPSFNIADSAITLGVGLLIIDMLFSKKPEHEKSPGP